MGRRPPVCFAHANNVSRIFMTQNLSEILPKIKNYLNKISAIFSKSLPIFSINTVHASNWLPGRVWDHMYFQYLFAVTLFQSNGIEERVTRRNRFRKYKWVPCTIVVVRTGNLHLATAAEKFLQWFNLVLFAICFLRHLLIVHVLAKTYNIFWFKL